MFRANPFGIEGMNSGGSVPFGYSSFGYSPGSGEFGADPSALSQTTQEQWEMVPGHREWDARAVPGTLYTELTGRTDFGRKGLLSWPDVLAQNAKPRSQYYQYYSVAENRIIDLPRVDFAEEVDPFAEEVIVIAPRDDPPFTEEVIVIAQRDDPPSPLPLTSLPPPSLAEQRSGLTERMLYRELAQSGYSSDAINRLNKYYEEQFPVSGGNLRELLLKRAAVFATASGGQWRQGDSLDPVYYVESIGTAGIGLLDYVGATIAGGSWKETASNLATGMLTGGVLGAAFGALRGTGAASRIAGDTGGTLKPQLKSALPPASSEASFADFIDNSEFSNHPAIMDRLSRARQFDVGGYKSLTAKGEYGRLWDGLDSDEALQNAFVRYAKDISRHDPLLEENPSTALTPELHRQIGNLTVSEMQGRSAADVLQFHIDQMRGFTPDFVLEVLHRESLKFIELRGL